MIKNTLCLFFIIKGIVPPNYMIFSYFLLVVSNHAYIQLCFYVPGFEISNFTKIEVNGISCLVLMFIKRKKELLKRSAAVSFSNDPISVVCNPQKILSTHFNGKISLVESSSISDLWIIQNNRDTVYGKTNCC